MTKMRTKYTYPLGAIEQNIYPQLHDDLQRPQTYGTCYVHYGILSYTSKYS
jgi:hypothetical protein